MKKLVKNLFLLPALIAGLGLLPAGRATAQTFTTLHSFTALIPAFTNSAGIVRHNNSDGGHPDADLILSGNTLYGTGWDGGNSNAGTVFKINTDGTGFTILHKFTARSEEAGSNFANNDGAKPDGVLVLLGNTLYGTAAKGGSSGYGALFAVNTDGTGFTTLHNFTAIDPDTFANSDGATPYGGLVLSGNVLYGTANNGGNSGNGALFAINTDGSGFTNLHSFTAINPDTGANSDGANPNAGLILSGQTLYGTTPGGGISANGTVFKLNTDGTGFTALHHFTYGSDGGIPYAELILSGNALYGTTAYGGGSLNGTVFKLDTNGAGFTTLHTFTATGPGGTNSDGASPTAGLFLSGSTLYGTTFFGGRSGNGALFAVKTNGTGFTNLHSFTLGTGGADPVNSDGANPYAGLILSGNTLYGVAQVGGSSGSGTIFSLSLEPLSSPQLTITSSGANVILAWPTNYAEVVIREDHYEAYYLCSTTNLASPVDWRFVFPMPVVVNGQLVVTNSVDDTKRFYRILKATGPLSDLPCLQRGPNPRPPCYECIGGVWTQFGNCRL